MGIKYYGVFLYFTSDPIIYQNPQTLRMRLFTQAQGKLWRFQNASFLCTLLFLFTIGGVKAQAPTGTFTIINNNTCSGTTVQFTSSVTGIGTLSYVWDYGDPASGANNTSSAQDGSHVYDILGCGSSTVTVKLTVTDAGATIPNVLIVSQTVTIKQRPDVRLADNNTLNNFRNCDNNPTLANPNFIVKVNNISPSAGCITSYTLDWGDGSATLSGLTNASFPITHTYTQLGAYNLSISAVGTNGCSSTKIYIIANQSNPAGGLATLGATTGLCAPTNIPFVISYWELNSPGTTYNLNFGDGVTLTLPHPLNLTGTPQTINHVYTKSSCPTPATYTVTLNAINACATTPYTAGNIQISNRPTADFTFPVGCVNASTCFTNTSVSGYYGSTCSRATLYSWDFGDPSSGANNVSQVASPCHIYSSPGLYSVTLIDSNQCGTSTKTQQVCITTAPSASFTIDNSNGCIPLAVNTTNASNIGNTCAPVTYAWAITYASGFCGTVTTPNPYTNGTTASSVNPSFNFTNPGTYTIRLTVSNICGSSTVVKTVTVKKPPTVSLPAISNSCGPVTITPLPLVAGCGAITPTYDWIFAGGIPATSTSLNPGPISFTSNGPHSISLTVTNECGASTTATQNFTIFQSPDVTVPQKDTFCRGEIAGPFTFGSSVTGTTFTWTNSNTAIGLGASGTGNIPTFTAANTGSAPITGTITVTPVNGCNGTPATFTITVYPPPVAPTATSPISYCQNESAIPLAATGTGTNALVWYTVATGGTPLGAAPTPLTTSIGTTTYYVSQSNAGQCEGPRKAIVVNVLAIPHITDSSFVNPTTCGSSTGSITLNGLTPNTNYTVKYIKNGSTITVTLTSNGSGSVTIPGLAAGTYSNISVTLGGCPSNEVGPISLSDPNPPPTPIAGGNTPICSGGTLNLTGTTTATGTITYIWSGPNTFTNALQNPTINNITVAGSGTYSLAIRVNGCTSPASTVDIVVNQTPVIPTAASNTPVCTDSTLQLTSATTTAGTINYAWTGPNGFTSTSQNPSIPNITTAASGAYTVTATLGTCTSAIRTINVVINQSPKIISSSFIDPTSCTTANGSITLTGLLPNTNYTVKYIKNTVAITAPIPSNAAGSVIILNLSAGIYTNITVTANGCPSNAVGPFTLTAPNPPAAPTVTGNSPLCAGGTLVLTASTTATGTVTYAWTGPSFTSTLQNPSITNVSTANAGTYSATATVNGCVSLPSTVTIAISAGITGNSISANQSICINTIPSLITGAVPAGGGGGYGYSWEFSINGGTTWTPTGTTTQDYQPGALTTTTMYRRMASTTLCSGVQAGSSNLVTITVNPDAKAIFTPTATKRCAPFTINTALINLTPFNDRIVEYRWYANNVYIGSGTSFPTYIITNPNDTVTIKLVTISSFGCKNDSTEHGFSTYPKPVPSFAVSDSAKCGPLSVTFTNTTPSPSNYNFIWNFGNGQTSTQAQPSTIIFQQHPLGGDTTYKVTLKAMGICDTIIETHLVRVIGRPRVLFTPSKTDGCSPMHVVFTNTTARPATFLWNFDDGTPTTTTDSILVHHTFHVGIRDTFYVKLIATNICGTDSTTYQIVVNPANIRLLVAANGTDIVGCAPHTVKYFNNSTGANAFNWDFGDGNTLTTTKGLDTISHTYILPGAYITTLNATNTCTDTTTSITITVQAKPVVDFSANPLTACIGDTINFTNLSTTGINYNWRFGDATTSILTNPKKTYTSAGTYRTWLVGSKVYGTGNSCSDSTFKDIIIRDTLPGDFTMTHLSVCLPVTVVFKNVNRPSASTSWDFGDGNTGTGDSVNHTYTLPGTYTLKMISKGLLGCNFRETKTVVIAGPTGTMQYAGGYLCLGDAKQFEILGSGATGYRFVFGDGDSLSTSNAIVSHLYTRPGTFIPYAYIFYGTCSLKVATGDTIKVDRVKAGFKFTTQQLCGSTIITFTDTSNAYFGIRQWQWNFGDATNSIIQSPVKIYTQSGLYQVRLRIIGISGCIDTITVPITITVHNNPVSTITSDTVACIGQPMQLNALVQSQDAITAYDWNFGNNTTGSGLQATATYNAPGTFIIRLISRTVFGCADTTYKTIRVYAVPIVNAGNDVRICRGQSIQLNATGATTWQWAPLQNLSCSTCSNPVANPSFTTVYTATGINSAACRTTDSITVEVVQPLHITVSPHDSICIGESSQLFAGGASRYTWNPSIGLDFTNIPNPISTPLVTTMYQVVGFDAYNCFSDTGYVRVAVGKYPTVDLGTGGTVIAGTTVNLNAVITNGPIKKYTWTPSRDLSCTNCGNPVATINTNILYKLEVETFYGCTASDTISFKVNCDPSQVFVPNAFSPDNDGINDILMVRAKGIAQVKYFRIFNRWGQMVFERSNISANDPTQGWDGSVNSKPATPDVYVYTAEVVCTAGGTFVYKGNVTLVK